MRPKLIAVSMCGRPETFADRRADFCHLDRRLFRSIAAAGALGAAVTPDADPEAVAEAFDAVVLSGGPDIPADLYGGDLSAQDPARLASRERCLWEIALAQAAADRGRKVLGVCLGLQTMNVAFGGTLADLPSEIWPKHVISGVPFHASFVRHRVEIFGSGPLARSLGEAALVASSHRQCAAALGSGLRICAVCDDGHPEAIESFDGRLLGVQWHPEAACPSGAPLFGWLAE